MRSFRDLLFAAGASVLLLIALEGALRLAGVKYDASFFVADQERGFALRPNAEGWELNEGESYVRINSDGLHDREHSLARPANVIRIAVLGSSETDAHQVPLEDNFPSILERQLNQKLARSGKRVEVLNFAVSGYALAQEYLTLRDKVWKYDPQIVILAHSPFTMLKNTREVYYGDTAGSPFFVYRGGKLELESKAPPLNVRRVWLKSAVSDLMNRSRLLSMANQAWIHLGNDVRSLTRGFHVALAAPPTRNGLPALPPNYTQTWPFLDPADPPGDPRLERTWRIGEGLIQRIREESLQHGAEFWMVVLNYAQEVTRTRHSACSIRSNTDSLL